MSLSFAISFLRLFPLTKETSRHTEKAKGRISSCLNHRRNRGHQTVRSSLSKVGAEQTNIKQTSLPILSKLKRTF